MERKPAHLAIIDEIERHCENLGGLEKMRKSGRSLLTSGFEQTVVLEMAAIPTLTDLLGLIIIPKEDLGRMIARLKCLTSFHCVILSAIKNLLALQRQ